MKRKTEAIFDIPVSRTDDIKIIFKLNFPLLCMIYRKRNLSF